MSAWRLLCLTVMIGSLTAFTQGCAFTAGAATGAVGAEVLEEEGYDLDSPIEKEEDDDEKDNR